MRNPMCTDCGMPRSIAIKEYGEFLSCTICDTGLCPFCANDTPIGYMCRDCEEEYLEEEGGREMNNPKMPSKGVCPVCKWPVKKGGMRRTVKGVRRWYHPSCFGKAK